MTSNERPAIAIIIPGGIGTGKDNIGVPVLNQIVHRLANHYRVTVFSLASFNADFKPVDFELIDASRGNSITRSFRFPFLFRRHHKRNNFVAVHGFWVMPTGTLAVAVGKLFGIRSVVSALGGDAVGVPHINYGRLHKPMYRWITLLTLRHADRINALTQYLVNNLRNAGLKRDVEVIPWGVDGSMFEYRPKPIATPVHFLHIGNFHPVKDQPMLILAFDLISKSIPATLTIIGSGDMEPEIRSMISTLALTDRVTIVEPVPYQQLPAFYHKADVLLHTSLSEGQCEVVTEAMSCGVVVCGTKVGLMHDLPEACVTVDIKMFESLAEEAIALVNDPVRMNDLRMKAHQWTLQHDIHWTVAKLIELYR